MKREQQPDNKYFIASGLFHAGIVLALVLSYELTTPLAVIENTNQHDVISAVVLGDTAKSKVLPHEKPAATPEQKPDPVKKPVPPLPPQPKPIAKKEPAAPETAPQKIPEKDAIALKKPDKKLAEKKAKELQKKIQENIAKDLLADIKKHNDKKTKVKKVDLQDKFAKMLREQSELSLRQNLLNESVKTKGKISRQSQGVIDKYKALIIQSIGEHWLVPLQADKSLTSELLIRLGPDGNVLDVKITKSSGDPSLDSSARAAVLKASPLPVPPSAEEFEPFRQFVLKVKPENIVES